MSSLVFANPAGFWALLAVPALLAIHFLQPRSRRIVVTTLFLLEHLPPLATTGRAWRWLRSSWALWLQIIAVLLVTWLLAGPRWLRPDATQTIAVVLDATASLRPFRAEAAAMLAAQTPAWERGSARTEWIVRETDPGRPVLYRGHDRARALAALADWRPDRGGHDFTPVLSVAHQLVRRSGAVVLVTDRPPSQTVTGTAVLAVGRPLDNAGFAGGAVAPGPDGLPEWSVLVHYHGAAPTTRTLAIARADGGTLREESLELAPGRLRTLSGSFPSGVDALLFRLLPTGEPTASPASRDALDLDDTLALLVPRPRGLTWAARGDAGATGFFRQFLERAPGLVAAADGETPDIALIAAPVPPPADDGAPVSSIPARLLEIRLHRANVPATSVATAPVVADHHPWIEGLAWSGLLGPGPVVDSLPAGAQGLLWQGRQPLAWLETHRPVPRLVLAWDWAASNASRLPAAAVMMHRVIEDLRLRTFAPEARNLDAGQALQLSAFADAGEARWTLEVSGAPPEPVAAAEIAALRAPPEPGLFLIRRNGEPWLRGASQFADPREGDFTTATTTLDAVAPVLEPLEARSADDRARPLWMLLLVAVLLASWAVQAPRIAPLSGASTP